MLKEDTPRDCDLKENLNYGIALHQSAKNLTKLESKMLPSSQPHDSKSPEMKEKLDEVGFICYLIPARLYHVDPKMNHFKCTMKKSLRSGNTFDRLGAV